MSSRIMRAHLALLLASSRGSTRLSAVGDVPARERRRRRGDDGQTTAEYGLVLLGAAGIAMLLVAWATKSGAIGDLFNTVMDAVIGKVK
jgi:Flp pilus assembly pilin Flp